MPQRSVIIIYALIAPMTSIKGPAEWCWRDQLPAICPQGRVAYQ
jgi:hypothetical protein